MDPRKDPSRRCRRLPDWPEADRRAWTAALQPGDELESGGFASAWKPLTRYTVEMSYGRWLTWLDNNQILNANELPARRASPANVSRYIADLSAINATCTVLSRIRNLSNALHAIAPVEDWAWLQQAIRRRRQRAVSSRNKRAMMIPSDELFNFGIELMNETDGTTGLTALRRADQFRDGLMIALLTARPVRRRNFASIEIGRHLTRRGTDYWLNFEATETKTNAPIDAPVPAALTTYLERYLTFYRPFLCRRSPRGNWVSAIPPEPGTALWVSNWCSAMSQGAIYDRIVRATTIKFGHALTPHLFRDCAATSIAIEDPEHVRITTSILGHASLATSERHYNHAQALVATRRYQKRILELRRESRDDEHPLPNDRSPRA